MCARLNEEHTFFDDPEGYRLAQENNREYVAPSAGERVVALNGYELAGCADSAGLIVSKGRYPDMVAADWDRFAEEIRQVIVQKRQGAALAIPSAAQGETK